MVIIAVKFCNSVLRLTLKITREAKSHLAIGNSRTLILTQYKNGTNRGKSDCGSAIDDGNKLLRTVDSRLPNKPGGG